LRGESPLGGLELKNLHLEQVSGLRAFDEDRPGQWMHRPQIHLEKIGGDGRGGHLPVKRVARFEFDIFAGLRFERWRDFRVPSIVSLCGLVGTPESVIEPDAFHGRTAPPAPLTYQLAAEFQYRASSMRGLDQPLEAEGQNAGRHGSVPR
jgi:hypothetical protein